MFVGANRQHQQLIDVLARMRIVSFYMPQCSKTLLPDVKMVPNQTRITSVA